MRGTAGIGIQLRIAALTHGVTLPLNQRNLRRMGRSRCFKNIGQHLMAQQIWPLRTAQNSSVRHSISDLPGATVHLNVVVPLFSSRHY